MGWSSSHYWKTPKDVHNHVLRQEYFGPEWKILGHAATNYGRHLWVAFESPKGVRAIGLWFIEKRDGECAYKSIDESMGPYEYDCPLWLLDMVPEPDSGYAKKWREAVRARHATSKQEWSTNEPCTIHGKPYTVRYKQARSWIVADAAGKLYRASPKHMKKAKVANAAATP